MKQLQTCIVVSLALLAIPATDSFPNTAGFRGLGVLPADSQWPFSASQPHAVSGDGSVVVGTNTLTAQSSQAFRWEAGHMAPLNLVGNGSSYAHAVSGDGSVVVGHGGSAVGYEAYIWQDGVATGLGSLRPGGSSYAYGASADGSVAVGHGESASGYEAYRWETGAMTGLGDLEGGAFFSQAFGVSGDGSVIVGRSSSESGVEAFRWASGAMEGLGYLSGGDDSSGWSTPRDGPFGVRPPTFASVTPEPGREGEIVTGLGEVAGSGFYSEGRDVSADGSVVVGISRSGLSGQSVEAFRWEDGVMTGLGSLAIDSFNSEAYAVSDDGSIVVGHSGSGPSGGAFIWNSRNGMQNLKDVLANDFGLDLTDWTLEQAYDISADGLTIVGQGINPDGNSEGWIATLDDSAPIATAGGPYVLHAGDNTPVMLGGSATGGHSHVAWDLNLDGLFNDAFGFNPLISSAMAESWGFSHGMTWDIRMQVTNFFGDTDISMTEMTYSPTPGSFLLGALGLSCAGWKLRRKR